ncbi:MAG: ABC transporter ATP-binding protein [Planctomycetes bacterium]|nr:ABC transporter ATP-binding protein [Planctomycetota bacterium]
MASIELRGVVKTFAVGGGEFTALDSVDLDIERGTFTAIVGRSGSGKSTLANMITGIDRPTRGVVRAAGVRVDELGERDLALWRGRNVGVVFQFFQLLPGLTILENVVLPMEFLGVRPPRERVDRASELLERFGIGAQARKLPGALSGGEQQRAAIARALANDPSIVVADEPTGNLDLHNSEAILELFSLLALEGKAVVMVTHERDVGLRADRVVTLVDGRIASIQQRAHDRAPNAETRARG